jgi:hypothetical protein
MQNWQIAVLAIGGLLLVANLAGPTVWNWATATPQAPAKPKIDCDQVADLALMLLEHPKPEVQAVGKTLWDLVPVLHADHGEDTDARG